jgi:PAS domain S-box-containing protein
MGGADISGSIASEVLASLAEGCQVIGFDWTYLYVNDAVVAHGRSTREQLLGRTMMECYPGIEETPAFEAIAACMRERLPRRVENEFQFPDGSTGWFELRCVPVPHGTCVLSLDVTERKRADEALRRSDERLRLLIDGVRDHALVVLDLEGRVVTWNTGAERLTGYSADEIVGAELARFFLPEEVLQGVPALQLGAAGGSRSSSGRRRRWRPWAGSPGASRTTSTTCCR